ncbi:putative toxin-antitoxin system toxin component, PIN family [bacterium]|nr:putative toxin-antitoxin system toxin component, PIN family [bacterium]MBU1614316.1 putative toxin-antitoxin system toxin component, PIN family [bacterium]
MVKVVIDTNVYISGTFWSGKPKKIINMAKRREISVVTSQGLLEELKDVLTREDKDFRLSEEEADKIIGNIRSYAELVKPTQQVTVCRDTKDNKVIECAIEGRADYIVSGDPDLKVLREYKDIQMVSPNELLEIL